MKILSINLENFGSYKNLNLDVSDQGLTLIHGKTGSGKSTIMDAVLWTLFGTTAKNGNADDVRPWNQPEPTSGVVTIQNNRETITITRKRGPGKNELHYSVGLEGIPKRGKDIPETQKLIENVLGFNASLYQTAAYYHELSPSASFFSSTAKHRRELFERIVDLSLPTKLGLRLSGKLSDLKVSRDTVKIECARRLGRIEQLELGLQTARLRSDRFSEDQAKIKKENEVKETKFKEEKEKDTLRLHKLMVDLEFELDPKVKEVCGECGQSVSTHNTDIRNQLHKLQREMERLEAAEYRPIAESKENPHLESIAHTRGLLRGEELALKKSTNAEKALSTLVSDMKKLQDLSGELRTELMQRSVSQIEHSTNRYLSSYFDGEFRVEFSANNDNIDVQITKDGNRCVYTQLSKGQKQLLKLCFSVSVMTASANNSGVFFNELFFDEPTDGCDPSFKVKSFDLFQELSKNHSSVFVIEHNEAFKSMFNKDIEVQINGNYSEIV